MDALLFGHIAAAEHEPLGDILTKFPTLIALHRRVLATYFQDDLARIGYLATQGVNVFEGHDRECADKKKPGAKAAAAGGAWCCAWAWVCGCDLQARVTPALFPRLGVCLRVSRPCVAVCKLRPV